jgi:hypothetical protein
MPPWHFTTNLDFFDHWQTLIAGALAVLAGAGTIWATIKSANREIAASQAQTDVAQQQIKATIYFARRRELEEGIAFLALLVGAMARVLAETAWARKALLVPLFDFPTVRGSVTKGGFEELRGGCLRLGSPLTGEFLDLEREIDNFARTVLETEPGLKQLDLIDTKAMELRDRAGRMGTKLVDAAAKLDPPDVDA